MSIRKKSIEIRKGLFVERVVVKDASRFFVERQSYELPPMSKADYLERIAALMERMKADSITHAVIYGDREHFSNIEYFTGYDCRFEESLLIIDSYGNKTIVVGNEGYSYSLLIPFEIKRAFYQHFSLQGQPRDKSPPLERILSEAGIGKTSCAGVVGYKYFEQRHFKNPKQTYDVPAYILEALKAVSRDDGVVNYTEAVTGLPYGVRMVVRSPKEIAWAEYAAGKCTNIVLDMFDALKVGETELGVSGQSRAELLPQSVHPMINFGAHIATGLRSPDETRLRLGGPCGLCYGLRGSLVSRVGVAAYDEATYDDELRPYIESFYKPFWSAIAAWYEAVKVGAAGGDVYEAVMSRIGSPEFGVALNPGHNIGMDEWTNSPMYRGSRLPIISGSYLQCDIITSGSDPVRSGICEDTVIVADAELRGRLKKEYPATFDRIAKRQRMMRKELGIRIDDSLLPMSNFNGVYFPFMLNQAKVFAKDE